MLNCLKHRFCNKCECRNNLHVWADALWPFVLHAFKFRGTKKSFALVEIPHENFADFITHFIFLLNQLVWLDDWQHMMHFDCTRLNLVVYEHLRAVKRVPLTLLMFLSYFFLFPCSSLGGVHQAKIGTSSRFWPFSLRERWLWLLQSWKRKFDHFNTDTQLASPSLAI